jgi:hypothetical protein
MNKTFFVVLRSFDGKNYFLLSHDNLGFTYCNSSIQTHKEFGIFFQCIWVLLPTKNFEE